MIGKIFGFYAWPQPWPGFIFYIDFETVTIQF